MDFIAKTPCVAVMAAAVAPTLLDLRVDLILPRVMALLRLTQGMWVAKCRLDSEWEFSAGQVHFTAGGAGRVLQTQSTGQ